MQSDSIHLPCAYLFLSLQFHHVGTCLSFDHSETNQSSSKFCYKQHKYPLTNEISTVFAAVSPIYLCIHEEVQGNILNQFKSVKFHSYSQKCSQLSQSRSVGS